MNLSYLNHIETICKLQQRPNFVNRQHYLCSNVGVFCLRYYLWRLESQMNENPGDKWFSGDIQPLCDLFGFSFCCLD